MGLGIRQEARRHGSNCLVVGTGGDEWLDGHRTYYAEAIAGRHWGELRQSLQLDSREVGIPQAYWSLLRYGVGPLLPARLRRAIHTVRRGSSGHDGWLAAPMRQRLLQRRAIQSADDTNVARNGQRSQLLQLNSAYGLLARESEERLCAWAGLEIRRPFWDKRLVEFAFATPERLRCSGTTSKALHRLAMTALLPESVLGRTSKADFMLAFRWSSAEIRASLSAALPDTCQTGYLRAASWRYCRNTRIRVSQAGRSGRPGRCSAVTLCDKRQHFLQEQPMIHPSREGRRGDRESPGRSHHCGATHTSSQFQGALAMEFAKDAR